MESPLLVYGVGCEQHDILSLDTSLMNAPQFRIRHFTDGSQLWLWLTHRLDGSLPHLIMVNLAEPLLNGHEILLLLSQDADLRSIPVWVFAGSALDAVQRRCASLSAGKLSANRPGNESSPDGAPCRNALPARLSA
ncbi:response regulator [Spirosoma koreense]